MVFTFFDDRNDLINCLNLKASGFIAKVRTFYDVIFAGNRNWDDLFCVFFFFFFALTANKITFSCSSLGTDKEQYSINSVLGTILQ